MKIDPDEFHRLRGAYGSYTASRIAKRNAFRRAVTEMVDTRSWALLSTILLGLIDHAFPKEEA